jgi:hypothetical protein
MWGQPPGCPPSEARCLALRAPNLFLQFRIPVQHQASWKSQSAPRAPPPDPAVGRAVSKALSSPGRRENLSQYSRVKFAPLALHVCHNQGSVHLFGVKMFAVATPGQIPDCDRHWWKRQRPRLRSESPLAPSKVQVVQTFSHSRRRLVFEITDLQASSELSYSKSVP